jgi:hypothetical protein
MPENKVVPLVSRYKSVHTEFRQLSRYLGYAVSDGHYVRCILDKDDKTITAIDFEGGPMLSVEGTIRLSRNNTKKIKFIKSVYLIGLE